MSNGPSAPVADLTAVVPTRNRLPVLRRTLGAVLDQRGVSIRVVVVDEGSSDGTPQYLAGLGDPRVEVIRNDAPVGVSAARNLGIAHATTPWVACCDDDDWWSPGKSRAQLDALRAAPGSRWAITGAVYIAADAQIIGHLRPPAPEQVLPELLTRNAVPASGSGLVVETALAREIGGYDESMRASEDWDFCVRLAKRAAPAVADHAHVAYRIWAGSMSGSTSRMRASFDAIKARHGGLAAELGTEFDSFGYERYMAGQEVKARRRVAAARSYASLARRGRRLRDLARAALAFGSPAWFDRVGDRRGGERVPTEWREWAEQWLAAIPFGGDVPPGQRRSLAPA
jgi:glycosyltransferase involved in cell wall biosynthesis